MLPAKTSRQMAERGVHFISSRAVPAARVLLPTSGITGMTAISSCWHQLTTVRPSTYIGLVVRQKISVSGDGCYHLSLSWRKERKEKERKEYLYSAIYMTCISQSAQELITQFDLQITPCLPFLRKHSQMAPLR